MPSYKPRPNQFKMKTPTDIEVKLRLLSLILNSWHKLKSPQREVSHPTVSQSSSSGQGPMNQVLTNGYDTIRMSFEERIKNMPFLMDAEVSRNNCCLLMYCHILREYGKITSEDGNAFLRKIQHIEDEQWGRRETGYWWKRQEFLYRPN